MIFFFLKIRRFSNDIKYYILLLYIIIKNNYIFFKFLLNSINYIPKKRNLLSVIDVNKNIMENEKCYYYKKYEKEIDFYKGDIIPNFLEMSIK